MIPPRYRLLTSGATFMPGDVVTFEAGSAVVECAEPDAVTVACPTGRIREGDELRGASGAASVVAVRVPQWERPEQCVRLFAARLGECPECAGCAKMVLDCTAWPCEYCAGELCEVHSSELLAMMGVQLIWAT